MVQSDKRWLSRCGVQREAAAEAFHPFKASGLNRVILWVEETIRDHIGHFAEGLDIETTRGQRGGSKT